MIRPLPQNIRSAAFTLVELMVTVAIMGILGGLTLAVTRTLNSDQSAYAAGQELLGWLESVQANATITGPCTVTITTGNALQPGSILASVTGGDARCSIEPVRLPSTSTIGTFAVATTFAPATSSTIVFSPRAGVVAGNVVATVKIASNGAAPVRCVRASFASISGGINESSSDVANNCTTWD